MAITLYSLKKSVLLPRTLYMRHVKERDLEEPIRTFFDANYYRRSLYDFTAATMANPHILVDADLDAQSTVLDVGAYVGDWSVKIAERYGSRIFAFEPGLVNLSFARKALEGYPRAQVLNYGLGGRDLTAKLSAAGPGSSVYAKDSPLGVAADVSIRDVAAVLDELGIEQVDLLKVNIEGGEFDLFDRLIETGWMPRIRQTMIQFHEFHPHAYRRRSAIRRRLRRTHTEVWNHPWVWEFWCRTAP